MITVDKNTVRVETSTLTAVLEDGFLTRLQSKANGTVFIERERGAGPASALQILYPGEGAAADVVGPLAGEIQTRLLSSRAAQVRFHGWDADGVLLISEDETTGDLIVEPSAYSSRPGALAVRYLLPGIRRDLDFIAPFFQGVRLKQDDPLLEQRRWMWPMFWEAGLAIWQGKESGFWLHCRDDRYRDKALHIKGGLVGVETEAHGPTGENLGAGGLAWRFNVYQGDWQVPAARYRDWLWHAGNLTAKERERKPWMKDIRLALSWYGGDPAILDALARRLDPKTVLIHFSEWRTDPYDENYPTFEPSENARAVFSKANAMGFHVMPHCNAVDMDPTHPTFPLMRDFSYRDAQSRRLLGWGYDTEARQVLGVPNSYHALSRNRRRKVMVKVHPGLAMWRAVLSENVQAAVETLATDTVFLDVTLTSQNLHRAIVENATATEGMKRIIAQVAALGDGLAVGGEGLNEVTVQELTFAQAHLFGSWQTNVEGLERTGECPLGDFLFGRLCRTFGYSGLSGKNEAEELRMRLHEKLGAIPTITVRSPQEIESPNPAVRRALDRAAS